MRKKILKLILARPHSRETIEKIKEKIFFLFGEKEIEIEIDESLIGGFRLISDEFLIKSSIKDFLAEIKNSLIK